MEAAARPENDDAPAARATGATLISAKRSSDRALLRRLLSLPLVTHSLQQLALLVLSHLLAALLDDAAHEITSYCALRLEQ